MIKSSIPRDLLILLIVSFSIWGGFVLIFEDGAKPNLIPVEKEEKLGKELTDQLFAHYEYTKLENFLADSAIQVIKNRLLLHLEKSPYRYKIHLIDNDMINAFALPGGNIVISKGIMKFSEKPEEIAAIIAHEMGHIENKHVISRLIKQVGINVITGGDQTVIGEVAKIAASTAFDRKQEEEADAFAYHLLEKANIHPAVMASFFRRLQQEIPSSKINVEWLSTHPEHDDRVKSALEHQVKDGFEQVDLDIHWNKVKESL